MPSFISSIIEDFRAFPNKTLEQQAFFLGVLITIICLAGLLYYIVESTWDEVIVLDDSKPGSFLHKGTSKNEKSDIIEQDTFDSFKKLMDQKKDLSKGKGERYHWFQSEREVDIFVPIDLNVKKADIHVKVQSFFLKVMIKGEVIIDDRFSHSVVPDESNWQIDMESVDVVTGTPIRRLWITVMKKEATAKSQFWEKVLTKDVSIDEDISRMMGNKNIYSVNVDDPDSIKSAVNMVHKKQQ